MPIFETRITWSKPSGDWGVQGVELGALPPKLYAALAKLKSMEDAIERLNDPTIPAWEAEDLMEELKKAAPYPPVPTGTAGLSGVRRIC